MRLFLLLMAATPALASEYTPSEDDLTVHKALSMRHWDNDCEAVEALVDDGTQTLQNLVDHAKAPSWVPMRAATCLVRLHATEKQPELERWVSDPAVKGLGMLALGMLDDMPEPVALAVANKALTDGVPELDAAERIAKTAHPQVRALVVEAK